MQFKVTVHEHLSRSQLSWIDSHINGGLYAYSLERDNQTQELTLGEVDVINITMFLKRNNVNYSYNFLEDIW